MASQESARDPEIISERASSSEMIIEIDAIEVVLGSGNGALKVLDIPRWRVEEGDQVAIFGPSG